MKQCKDVWLGEVSLVLRDAHPMVQKLFKVTNTQIGVCGQKPRDWGALLVTSTRTESAQGQHRKDMDIICEEASGVKREIIEQYKGTLTNPNAMFLQIGNPNTRDCAFFDCFTRDRAKWTCLHWNAEETPASEWFDPKRNKDLEEEFGRDSDVYRVRVLGEFPIADPNCIISIEDLEKCLDKGQMLWASQIRRPNGKLARQIGLDIARFGDDESVIGRRHGNALVSTRVFHHVEPMNVVDEAFRMQHDAFWKDEDTWYVPDADGIGGGAMALFYEAQKNVMEFHSLNHSINNQYENRITEAWFNLASLCKKGKCYLPKDPLMIQQLTTRQYFVNRKGKIVVEKKDDYKKRNGGSPDRADMAVMTFYDEVEADGWVSGTRRSGKRVGSSAYKGTIGRR